MRDKLAAMPGLTPHPYPGTPEHDALEAQLAFAIEDRGNTREAAEATIIRFMVGRGYWPLGTTIRVTKKFKTKVKFPGDGQP